MAIDISGVNAKIDRAYEHLYALNAHADDFLHKHPYGFRHETDEEGRKHSGFLDIFRQPDVRFGILIGDCASNFRAALDHLIFALASEVLSDEELRHWENRLAFPICTTEDAWNDAVRGNRLHGLSDELVARIKRQQPYITNDSPDNSGLAALEWLNNRDKHRFLHVVIAYALPDRIDFRPAMPKGTDYNIFPPPYMEDGAPVLEMTLPHPIPDMQMNLTLMMRILVRDAVVAEDIRERLLKIGQTVQRLVADLPNRIA
jgi:hypothetical protein